MPSTRVAGLLALLLIATALHSAAEGQDGVCVPAGEWAVPEADRALRRPSAQVLAQLARQQVVLLGESHENAEHHRWQLHTLAGLHAIQPNLVLGVEMLTRRVQPVLDRWVAGELTETEFLAQASWTRVWGYDASLYLPIFQFARMNRVPVVALNVERALVSRVGDEGWAAVPPAEREGVGDPAPPTRQYLEVLHASFLDHHHAAARAAGARRPPTEAELAEPRFRRFVEGQQVWDRAMAERLAARARAAGAPLVVGLMGSGHVRDGHGVPHQLRALGVPRVATALPWETSAGCAGLRPGLADALYGVETRPATDDARRPRLGIGVEAAPGGVRIRDITPGSVAEQAGLRPGDVITDAAGEPVRDPAEVAATVRRQPPGTILPLTVQRGQQTLEIQARFPTRR
jgi:uncharacterized iron-regulated protein